MGMTRDMAIEHGWLVAENSSPIRERIESAIMSGAEQTEQAKKFAERLLQEHDALTAYVFIKQTETIAKQAMELLKNAAINAASDVGAEKEITVGSAKIKTRRVTEYEYYHPRLTSIETEMKKLTEEEKNIKLVLRNLKSDIADPETGEIISPAKKTRDGITIAISFAK